MRVTRRRVFYVIIIIVIGLLVVRTSSLNYNKRQEQITSPQVQAERIIPVQVARVYRGEIKSF